MAFNVWDDAGLICQETGVTQGLASGEFVLANGSQLKLDEFQEKAKADEKAKKLTSHEASDPFVYLQHFGVSLPVLQTSNPCQSMRILLEQNATYLIRLEGSGTFSDWDGAIWTPFGYHSLGRILPADSQGNILPTAPADVRGDTRAAIRMRPLQMLRMIALVPLRRELFEPWFRVVARIGAVGARKNFSLLISRIQQAPSTPRFMRRETASYFCLSMTRSSEYRAFSVDASTIGFTRTTAAKRTCSFLENRLACYLSAPGCRRIVHESHPIGASIGDGRASQLRPRLGTLGSVGVDWEAAWG